MIPKTPHEDFVIRKGKSYISVTKGLEIINDEKLNKQRGFLGNVEMDRVRDLGAEKGNELHYYSAMIDRGKGMDIDYESLNETVYNNVQAFRDWQFENVVKSIVIEKRFFSDRYLFHGTPDRVYLLKGQTMPDLIDFKTGKVLNMKKIRYQLSGYKEMLKEKGIETNNRIVLHFKNGKIKPIPLDRRTHENDFRIFIYLKECYLDYHSK